MGCCAFEKTEKVLETQFSFCCCLPALVWVRLPGRTGEFGSFFFLAVATALFWFFCASSYSDSPMSDKRVTRSRGKKDEGKKEDKPAMKRAGTMVATAEEGESFLKDQGHKQGKGIRIMIERKKYLFTNNR